MSLQDSFVNLSKLLEAAKTTKLVTAVLIKKPPLPVALFPVFPFKNAPFSSGSRSGNLSCLKLRVDSWSQTDNGASSSFVSL